MAPPLSTGQMAVNGQNSFNHSRAIRPEQLSPRTASSSSPSSTSDSESDHDLDAAGPPPSASPAWRPETAPPTQQVRISRIVTHAEFVVEELSNFGDSDDDERLGVIQPCAIEYAESEPSGSPSRKTAGGIDPRMMFNMGNLNCSDDSDETDIDEYEEFLMQRRAEKRRKRMTSGSIGKRTISESIGSDTDLEDLKPYLNTEEVGSSARRLRRRVGDRRSLQFPDPPPPRIDELDEPDSSEDEIVVDDLLARELPYYEYISMEVDSP